MKVVRLRQVAASIIMIRTALPMALALQAAGWLPCLPFVSCHVAFDSIGRSFVIVCTEAALTLVRIVNGSRIALFLAAAMEAVNIIAARSAAGDSMSATVFLSTVRALSLMSVLILVRAGGLTSRR